MIERVSCSWCRGVMGILLVTLSTGVVAGPNPLKLVRDLSLPGGPRRFDYQWIDSAGGRLYIAHLGADSVDVFDLRAGSLLAVIEGLPSVHGVVAAPERHLVFATVTGEAAGHHRRSDPHRSRPRARGRLSERSRVRSADEPGVRIEQCWPGHRLG